MVDRVSPEVRSRMMASIRGRDTQPELIVRRYLHNLGFRYRIAPRDLPGKPDLVLRKHGAAVFVHGCFWHSHQGCRLATVPATRTAFWEEKLMANRTRDHLQQAKVRAAGWRIAVVWECALKSDREAALSSLAAFLRSEQDAIEIGGQPRR